MICSSCGEKIPDEASTCPQCGANAAHVDHTTPPAVARDTEAALAAANLCRMRGMWHEAEAKGIDVLRLDPNNVHAHSLIGDLYRDQGRLDEAAQWYRMALDLSADSRADRVKLDQVEAELARRSAAGGQTRSMPTGAQVGTQKLMGASPIFWVRALTVTSVVFLVGVVVLLAFGRSRGQNTPPVPVTNAPQVSPPGRSGSPVPLPSGAGPAGSGAPSTHVYAASEATTPEETALRDVLSKVSLSSGTTVADVRISRRDSRASVILVRQTDAAGADRGSMMLDAVNVARVVGAQEPHLKHAAVSVRVRQGANQPAPAFDGDIDLTAIQTVPQNASFEQMEGVFSSLWTPGQSSQPSVPPQGDTDSGL